MNIKINKLLVGILLSVGLLLALPASAADFKAGRAAFDANSCSSCHQTAASTIGPSLKEIAGRYKGKAVATDLAQRIREGSEGRWGGAAHPAYEGIEQAEALLMAKWILAGAPK